MLGLGYLGFKNVPEKKAVKNRVHFVVDVESIEAAVVLAIAVGKKGSQVLLKNGRTIFK